MSVQESLVFKVNVSHTGMTVAQINQFKTALTQLSALKFTGNTGSLFTGIDTGAKRAVGSIDQLIGKSKTLDSTIKTNVGTTNQWTGALRNMGVSLGGISGNVDKLKGSVAGLTAGLSPLNNLMRQTASTAQSTGSAMSNSFRTALSTMTMYTAEGRKVIITNNEMGTSSLATASQLDRLRASYVGAGAGSQQYVSSTTAAVGANQRMTTSGMSLTNALNQQNAAIVQTTANVNKLAQSQAQSQQQTMSMVRGISTMFMGFMMLNQSLTDYRLNQESMVDLNDKLAETQERYNKMVERFGKDSYMADQALSSMQKTERAIRYETREMANQIQNQIFLMAMIAQNVMSDAIPAFMKWGETSEKLRGIFGKMGAGLKSFADIAIHGSRQASTSMAAITAATNSAAASIDVLPAAFNRADTSSRASVGNISRNMGLIGPAAIGAASAIDILPAALGRTNTASRTIIPGLQGMNAQLNTSRTILPGLPATFGTVVTSMDNTTRATGGLRGAFTSAIPMIARLGAVGLIAAAGLTIYATNTFGARDAINGFGRSIGQQIPILAPFGDLLVGIAGKLGVTGDSAQDVAIHFERAGIGFSNMSTLWNNTIADLVSSTSEFEQKLGQSLDRVGQSTDKLQNNFTTQVGFIQASWDRLWTAMEQKDYGTVVDEIGNAFASLPAVISTSASDISSFFSEVNHSWALFRDESLNNLGIWQGDWLTTTQNFTSKQSQLYQDGFNGIVGIIAEVGSRLPGIFTTWITNAGKGAAMVVEAITGAFTDFHNIINSILDPSTWVQEAFADDGSSKSTVDSWVKTNITDPINGFVEYITVTASQIWDQIVSVAGSVTSTVTTWVNKNIVDPIDAFIDNISVTAGQIWTKIVGGAGSIISQVNTWVNGNIVSPIDQFVNKITANAGQIIQKILDGDYAAQVINWASGVAAKIQSEILGFLKPIIDPAMDILLGGATAGGDSIAGASASMSGDVGQLFQDKPDFKGNPNIADLTPPGSENLGSNKQEKPFWDGWFGPAAAYGDSGGGQFYNTGGVITPGNTGNRPGSATDPNVIAQNRKDMGLDRNILPQYNPYSSVSPPTSRFAGVDPNLFNRLKTPVAPTTGGITTQDVGVGTQEQAKIDALNPPAPTPERAAAQRMMATENFEKLSDATKKSLGEEDADQEEKLADLAGYWGGLVDIQKVSASEMITLGQVTSDLSATLQTNSDMVWANGIALQDNVHRNNLLNSGITEQQLKYQDLQAGILKNTGVIKEYNTQLNDQQFINDNVTAGMQAQQIAFNDQTVAIAQNQGALQAYAGELASGRLQQNAFTEGQQAQSQAFYDTIIASEQARGSYTRLNEQLGEGLIQNAAWNKGLAEGRLEIANQTLAVEEAAGSLTAYQEGIASGVVTQNAFMGAVWETNRAVAEAFVNLEASRGALQEYTYQVSTGAVQYNAYNQAVLDTKMSWQELNETIAASKGRFDETLAQLSDMSNRQNMVSEAFYDSSNSALDFAQSLITLGATNAGMISGLDKAAGLFGYDLPNNFQLTQDSAEGLVSAFSGISGVIKTLASESAAAGRGLLDGVVGAIQDGGKEVNEELEALEDELGTNFPESVKDALESSALTTAMADSLEKMIDLGQEALINGADKLEVKKMVDDKAQEYIDAWEENGLEMSNSTATIFDAIREHISKGPAEGPDGMHAYLEQMDALMKAAQASTDPLATSVAELSNFDFGPAIKSLSSYGSALDGVVASFKEVGPAIEAVNTSLSEMITSVKDFPQTINIASGGDKNTNATRPSGAPDPDDMSKWDTSGIESDGGEEEGATDTSGIQGMIDQLNALNLALAQIPVTFTTAFTTGTQNAAGMVTMLSVHIGTEMTKWVTALAQIAVDFTTHFTTGTQNAAGMINLLSQHISGAVTIWNTTIASVAVGFTQQFTLAVQSAGVALDLFSQLLITYVTAWGISINAFTITFAQAVTTAVQTSALQLDLFSQLLNTYIAAWGTSMNTFTVTFAQAVTTAVQVSGQQLDLLSQFFDSVMAAMLASASTTFTTISNTATTTAATINRVYNTLANAIIGYFTSMATRSASEFTKINTAANNTANTINRAINQAVNAAIGYISQLSTRSASAFQTMANNATKVADAVSGIGSAASAATGQVQSLASALESIPSQVNTTINVGISGPGAAYLQGGTSGQVYFEEGGNEFFADGEGDKKRKKKRRAIVGETNDEKVIRTGLRTGTRREETVTHMKTLTNLGMHEPELLQVIPTRGYYAQRFKEKSALGRMGSGVMGGLAKMLSKVGLSNLNSFFASGTESPQSSTVTSGKGFGVSPGAQPNTASGPITISNDGRIHLYDGQSKTLQQWSSLNDNQRFMNAESDDVGIKSIPEDKYLNEDYTLSDTNSGIYSRYVRNTTWQQGPNAGQPSGVYNTGGGTGTGGQGPPSGWQGKTYQRNSNDRVILENGDSYTRSQWNALSDDERMHRWNSAGGIKSLPQGSTLFEDGSIGSGGGSGTGGGGGTSYNNDPNTWKTRSVEGGTFDITDQSNTIIARGFNSPQQASGYIAAHKTAKQQGSYTGPRSAGQNIGNNYTVPSNVQLGGAVTGGGGSGTVTGDKNTLGPGGAGYYKDVRGYNVPGYIQSPGHGASNSAKWKGHNPDPRTWVAKPMMDDPSLWKVVDDKGINIAAKFKSEAEANEFIQENIFAAFGNNGGNTGGGGGNNNGGGNNTGGGGGTPPAAGQPGYIKPGGWGAGGWYEDWDVVPMTTQPGKFKVIDLSDGKTLAQDFTSEDQAWQWVDYYKNNPETRPTGSVRAHGGLPSNYGTKEGLPPNFGGGGNNNGGGGGGGTTTPGTSYTAPSGVRDYDQVVADAQAGGDPVHANWQGANTSNPETWQTIRMEDEDPTSGTPPTDYKITDSNGKTIAVGFKTQAEAQAYVDAHKQAKQGGSFTDPIGGGGILNIPGTGGGTGGTGNNNIPQPGQTSGTGSKWQGANQDKNTWRVVEMSDSDKKGKWKVVDDKGKNIAAMFNSREDAELWLAHQKGQQTPPPFGGGTGNGSGSGSGSGNGNGTGNNNTGGNAMFPEGFPFQNAPKGPNGGPIIGGIEFPKGFPFHKTGLPGGGGGNNNGGGGSGGGGSGTPTTGGQPLSNAYLAGAAGASYNHLTSTHLGPVTTTGTGTGTIGAGTTSGVTGTTMSNIQQSQIVNQGSTVNQGNQSSVMKQSGQNSQLQIRNGQVITATGIYAGQGGTGTGTGTGTGSGGTGGGTLAEGQVRDTILKSIGLYGGISPFLQGQDIPANALQDSVNSMIDNQAGPLLSNYTGSLDLGKMGVPTPGTPGGGGGGGGGTNPPGGGGGSGGNGFNFDWLRTLLQAINRMVFNMTDKLRVNVVNQIDNNAFSRVMNNALLQNMKRY